MLTASRPKNYHVLAVIFTLCRLFISYISYNFLTGVVLIFVVFFFIFIINLTGGDLNLIGFEIFANTFKFLNIPDLVRINGSDIMKFFALLSFAFVLLGIIFPKIWYKTGERKFSLTYRKRLLAGIFFISLLFILAVFSAYLPYAANGAKNIWPVLIFFWVVALVCLVIYVTLMKFQSLFTLF
jgi:hypothetical protein